MSTPTQPEPCTCILNDPGSPYEGHTDADHQRERCTGRWTDEPPCGGCINCDMARAYHYQHLQEQQRVAWEQERLGKWLQEQSDPDGAR